MIKFTITGEPRTKKNSQQIFINKYTGKRFITQSDLYKKYEADCKWFMPKLDTPIDDRINLKCIYYKSTNVRVDLNNLLEATTDILVKYGVLADDNVKIIDNFDGSRVFIDEKNPRVEVTIDFIDKCNKEECAKHVNCKGCRFDKEI